MPRGLRFSRQFGTFEEWLRSHSIRGAYASRIARTYARYPTASLSQLRRHPRTEQLPLSRLRRTTISRLPFSALSQRERFQRQRALTVLSEVRRGTGSLSARARAHGISRSSVRSATGAFRKSGGRWVASRRDRIQRWLKCYEDGRRIEVLVDNSRTATLLSKYAHAVNEYLVTRDSELFRPFRRKTYRDAFGDEHSFETDPDAIIAAIERSESDFGSFADLYAQPEAAGEAA